jgi:hypothetical protein
MASVVSALAIVASVVYASIQIRQNTRAVTASAFQHVVNSFAEYSFEIGKDGELANLCFRGNHDYYSLNEVERMRYGIVHLSFLRRAENVLFSRPPMPSRTNIGQAYAAVLWRFCRPRARGHVGAR